MLRAELRAPALAAAVVLVTGLLTGCDGAVTGPGRVDTVGQIEFANPLAIPALDAGTVADDGVREYELVAAPGSSTFLPGTSTPTWGFDGAYLGPTLQAAAGERVRIRVVNELPEATTVHWHGMHLPARMDGNPHQLIEPGGQWTPTWRVDQRAATLWYHPHPHGETEEHVEHGLAGLFLITDAESESSGLPNRYGVDDVPVIVQDRRFDADGRFTTDVRGFVGALGDQVLVNGTLAPYLEVSTEAVRLRILNGSSARIYDFGFDDGRQFDLVATDGGLLTAPHATDHVQLSPGERAEIVVRVQPGERPVLRSNPPDLGMQEVLANLNGGADALDVLELRAADVLEPSPPVPATLASFERLDWMDAVVQRDFRLDGLQINGQSMEMEHVNEVVEVDTTEIWRVENVMAFPHSFHVHDVQFNILDIGGQPPPAELAGWKDTVNLPPNVVYRLIMRFEDYTDPDVPYMYHCHLLAHEDAGMMGQFTVVRDADEAPTELVDPGHGGGH